MPRMKNPTWPKAFAFIGLTVMGLALAYYSTSISTAGIAGVHLGTDPNGVVFTMGTASLLLGLALEQLEASAVELLDRSRERVVRRRDRFTFDLLCEDRHSREAEVVS